MSPASLTMKANTFGHDCDKLVQLWKGNCELEVAKQNCFRAIKDHLQQLSFLPKLPNTGDVKEFLSQLKQPSTANSSASEICSKSEDCWTLDLSGLNLCCNFSSKSVLDDTLSVLQNRGVEKDVVIQCLEDISLQRTNEASILDTLICCTESKPDIPSYQIIGDNLDLDVKVRHMDSENKNKSFHWFNLVAFKDQVSGSHLPDVHEKTLDDVPISAFLPSKEDMLHLKEDFVVLWSRVLVKYMKAFGFLRRSVIYHIPHAYSQIMTESVEEVDTIHIGKHARPYIYHCFNVITLQAVHILILKNSKERCACICYLRMSIN